MFILRRILKDNTEVNTNLGEYYTLQLKERSLDQFNDLVSKWSIEDLKGVYGVIVFNDGSDIMPLYEESRYYVMTSDGRTFDNVSATN